MQATLVSLALAAGIGFACCQSAGAALTSSTTKNDHAAAATNLRMAWTIGSTKGAANTARQQGQHKGSKGKQ
jgi:hypothetical protein